MKSFKAILFLFIVLGCCAAYGHSQSVSNAGLNDNGKLIKLPIRIHLLKSDDKMLSSTIKKDEVKKIFLRVNEIWKLAGIKWEIESFTEEKAQNREDYQKLQKLGFGVDFNFQRKTMTSVYPKDNLLKNGWNIFFISDLGVMPTGVYHAETQCLIVGQKSDHEDLNPSIVAHELGHSLSLPHTTELYNLMAVKQEGIKPEEKIRLTQKQIDQARSQAEKKTPFSRENIQ